MPQNQSRSFCTHKHKTIESLMPILFHHIYNNKNITLQNTQPLLSCNCCPPIPSIGFIEKEKNGVGCRVRKTKPLGMQNKATMNFGVTSLYTLSFGTWQTPVTEGMEKYGTVSRRLGFPHMCYKQQWHHN